MNLNFNYTVRTNPQFYFDQGPGQISFYYKNISIGLDLKTVNGVFQYNTVKLLNMYFSELKKIKPTTILRIKILVS